MQVHVSRFPKHFFVYCHYYVPFEKGVVLYLNKAFKKKTLMNHQELHILWYRCLQRNCQLHKYSEKKITFIFDDDRIIWPRRLKAIGYKHCAVCEKELLSSQLI